MIRHILFLVCLFCFLACSESGSEAQKGIKPDHSELSHQAPEVHEDRYQVGILVTDGVYNTELTAPYDIFQHTQFRTGIKAMDVFTIAPQKKLVRTFEGLHIMPDYGFLDNYPPIDILVVPSAEHHLDSDLQDSILINWIQKTGEKAAWVTSHCDGAFMLAKAGLLSDVASTTFPSDIEAYKEMFPDLDVRDSVLFVHDDKFITSAGGAKSFEAALYLCEFLYGKEIADQLAVGLVIDWQLSELKYLIVDEE